MSRHPLVPAELTRGPFTLVEARQAGLIRRQLQGASWQRVGSSLHVWAPLADKPALLLEAVHRRLPVAAVFSGQTAAWLHGLDLPPCDPVEVTISESSGISARAGMVVRRAELADRRTHRESLLEDSRRQNRLINAGFRLLRFAAADVHRTPDSIVAVVRAALCPPDLKPACGGG